MCRVTLEKDLFSSHMSAPAQLMLIVFVTFPASIFSIDYYLLREGFIIVKRVEKLCTFKRFESYFLRVNLF